MRLHYSAASPFVRKVVAVALHHGIALDHVASNPHASPADLLADNPLSKVPALVTDDGMTLPDSPLACEYLDSIGTRAKLYPAGGLARWKALRLEQWALKARSYCHAPPHHPLAPPFPCAPVWVSRS